MSIFLNMHLEKTMIKPTQKTQEEDDVVKDTTCFLEHKKRHTSCKNKDCRFWINYPDYFDCTIIASDNKTHTLQEIGDLFGITRMRICQIEKGIIQKLIKNRSVKKL